MSIDLSGGETGALMVTPARPNTPEEITSARITVAQNATDADDCRELLAALGIGGNRG